MNKLLEKKNNQKYEILLNSIGILLEKSRRKTYSQLNQILVNTYWEIGKMIVQYELENQEKGGYGTQLFEKISGGLREKYGRGFSRSNVIYMRLLYLNYPKSQTLSDQLSWSHYVELLMIGNKAERSFYEKQCLLEGWSVREFQRQKESALFTRLALSRNKQQVRQLARQGQVVKSPRDAVKDPYVLEFLGLPENASYSEKDLEKRIIENLRLFLLELGKGFTFVSRQYRLSIANRHYYVDLVFYHRILKCFVLIDLKIGSATPQDVGQMNLYLNYFKKEEQTAGDNEPIGIILAADREHLLVEYALGGLSNKLFVSKYQLYLPSKEELEREIKKLI